MPIFAPSIIYVDKKSQNKSDFFWLVLLSINIGNMRISSLVLVLYLLVNITVSAQVTVKGKITDQNGRGIEYVSITVDSLLAISDAEGNYEISVPNGHVSNMIFHHIAYRPYQLPYDVYKLGTQNVQLEENAYELSNVIVSNKALKEKSISHKGLKTPGDVSFKNIRNSIYEIGPVIDNNKDYMIKDLNFKVEECTYTSCTVRIIIYEINDKKFVPVQHRPIYIKFSDKSQFKEHTIGVNEEIILKKNHTYYIGVAVVSTNGKGIINFPAYLRSGYVRNLSSGKIKKFPATLGISMRGLVW
jgi:hypothetical protein